MSFPADADWYATGMTRSTLVASALAVLSLVSFASAARLVVEDWIGLASQDGGFGWKSL